ncbi:MAG: DUF402 domain-containing protein [Defluviitaleaceae bacterium]|nr:DUF402 domain-containing protein [Defluviitaleaceae bacterium]
MRKKEILGNFVKNEGVLYTYSIKKLTEEPDAYSALICFLPGTRELYKDDGGRERLCLAGSGVKWLMYLPLNEKWCVTTFYSPENKILEWYFDISKSNFLDETGMPCTDDIFLDLVILPDGRTVTLDADELRDALENGEITAEDYDNAYKVHNEILQSKWNDIKLLTLLSNKLFADYEPV